MGIWNPSAEAKWLQYIIDVPRPGLFHASRDGGAGTTNSAQEAEGPISSPISISLHQTSIPREEMFPPSLVSGGATRAPRASRPWRPHDRLGWLRWLRLLAVAARAVSVSIK